MNLIPPKQWDSFYDLYGGGRVYFGRTTFGEGQHAGIPPIVAKFEGLEPHFPSEPFVIETYNSMFKINKSMEEAGGQFQVIPDWLRADCYEYFWRKKND